MARSVPKKRRVYMVWFRIGNRWGRQSSYSIRDIAISLVDRWSINEREFTQIIDMKAGEQLVLVDGQIGFRRVS